MNENEEELKELIYEVDINKENYSQRNNEYVHYTNGSKDVYSSTTCQVTAIVQALDYAGYKFPSGKYKQPEDNLAEFILNNNEIDAKYAKSYPAYYKAYKAGEKGAITPNEIHKLLAMGTNLWFGCDVVTFNENTDFIHCLYENIIVNSLPIVVSGSFPKSNGKRLGHIVTVTGVKWNSYPNGDLADTPTAIKIDDPYGNTLNDWQGSGNNIWLPWNYVVANLKPLGNQKIKWTHTFKKPVAII